MRRTIPAAVLVLVLTPLARSQCYRTSYAQAYHAPTYYQPTYVAPHYDQYSYTAVVGAAYPVYLPLLSYTALADDVRSYYSTRKATKDAYLEALREAASEGLFGGTTAQPQPQPQPQPFNPPPGIEGKAPATPIPERSAPPPAPQPPQPKGQPGGVQIGKLLATRCATCHNPTTEPNHYDLSGPVDKIPDYVRDKCVVQATSGRMPKKGEKLTQLEYDALVAWAEAAPPNIAKAIPAAQPADKK